MKFRFWTHNSTKSVKNCTLLTLLILVYFYNFCTKWLITNQERQQFSSDFPSALHLNMLSIFFFPTITEWQATCPKLSLFFHGTINSFFHFLRNGKWVKSLSHVRLFEIPWTVAHQAFPSMGLSKKQDYWSGLPLPSPGALPDPEIEPRSPTLQADALIS